MSAHAQTPHIGPVSAQPGIDMRRGFDCLLALVALVLLVPLLAVIAAAIWIESGGPVFFSQTRLGQGARRFRLHKFRKFSDRTRHGQAQQHGLSVTLRDDPRMTRVGRVLERTKLDELPQLWNIVVGEMALVGPRPESLAFANCFNGAYRDVLDHRPGIFGPCQAVFRNESRLYGTVPDPEDFYRNVLFPMKAQIDLAYFPNRTTLSDMAWVIRSVTAIFGWSPLPSFEASPLDDLRSWVQQFTRVSI